MTSTELLQATGNIWKVRCYRDGNRRQLVQVLYARCASVLAAESVGRRESGCKCVDASPWNPARDRVSYAYIGFSK